MVAQHQHCCIVPTLAAFQLLEGVHDWPNHTLFVYHQNSEQKYSKVEAEP